MKRLLEKINYFFASNTFFYLILVTAFIEGLWVVLSLNSAGLGFNDEVFHFGMIKANSEVLNPLALKQSDDFNYLGDISRHSSYMYYFLLGKILNIVNLFTLDEFNSVLVLRIVNLLFFVSGLVVFAKLFSLLNFSKKSINLSLLLFLLIPVFPMVSGLINYDNLAFLLTGLILLLATNFIKSKKTDLKLLSLIFIVGVFGSLTKFAFLPIFLIIAVYIVALEYNKKGKSLFVEYRQAYKKMSNYSQIAIALSVIIPGFLFIEQYGYNLVKYKNIEPTCNQIISEEKCSENYIWARNNIFLKNKPEGISKNIFTYGGLSTGMLIKTKYLVVLDDSPPKISYYTYQILVLFGVLIGLFYLKEIARTPERKLIALVAIFYSAVLYINLYSIYLTYGRPIATNGRYFMLVMPILIIFALQAFMKLLNKLKLSPTLLAIVIVVLILNGGGVFALIINGNQSWYWNENVTSINLKLKKIIDPVIMN